MSSPLFQFLASLLILGSAFIVRPHSEQCDGEAEDIHGRAEWERVRLCDPATGQIPPNMRARELEFAKGLPTRESLLGAQHIQENNWQPTGPYNIGGRTRAIAIDRSNESTLLAGQVSGGIWKSTDGGAHWRRTTAPSSVLGATCLCQDPRPGKQKIWYAGTGELWGNSASLNGSGMYKSTDNGESWTSLSSTYNNTPESWDNSFEFIWRIVVDPTNTTNDVVYAATALGCVQRSTDGGQTWTQVLGRFANGYGYFSEVAISSTGVLYATISQQSSPTGTSTVKGIYRSTNGTTWTNISPSFMPTVYGRIAIGIAPSDESQVYFLANTKGTGFREVDYRGTEDWTSLYKYHYLSGDGSGSGGSWEDRSQNLPKFGGTFGDYQSQGSYDLHIRVHPTNPDVVYVGGTNLYRSDDGFTTPTWFWCGGYGPGTTLPFYEVYPNNHPDQHELIFYPSNPDRAICSCDGGVFRTENVRAGTVQWTSLNNGYQTTQFYTCAIDHATTSHLMLGGLQDNGTACGKSLDATKEWTNPGRGDGSYCAIANDGNVYMSSQQGSTGRFQLDTNGNVVHYSRIDPKGTTRDSFLFVNPFCLDPTNNKRLIMPYQHTLYRYSDATVSAADTWTLQPDNILGFDTLPVPRTSKIISAVSLSTVPAERLYYGTQDGSLYRVDNAMQASVNPVDITSSTFPRGTTANIECIAVNPHNADSILVVFSNYNVQSLFFSSDGGSTWSTVGGNLEGSVNGVGNGPSCRWATFTFVHGKCLVYVGTSVGLFCTALLNGINTVWVQEGAQTIGNAVVTMMDYRESDNFMAVATHGAGMYAGTVQDLPPAPEKPTLLNPTNGQHAILSSQVLSWKASANTAVYSLDVAQDSSFNSITNALNPVKTTQAQIDGLIQGRKNYYWRVRAYGAGGISSYSDVWTFRTAIEAPVLVSPDLAATNQPLNVGVFWSPVSGAVSYHLQVSAVFGFATPTIDTVLSDTTLFLTNLLSAKRYYWRVASIDVDGQGEYSVPRNFVTEGSSSVDSHPDLTGFSLSPSPVQSIMHLQFSLQSASTVRIALYDLKGVLIREVDNSMMSPMTHNVPVDCSQLRAGVYIVRLSTARDNLMLRFVKTP